MEERILEAIEYITISLDDIKDYLDFLKYKPELIKAINDIKNIIKNKNQININETMDNGEAEKSKISSILGLQFDYDPLINEDEAKFFSDYDENNDKKSMKRAINQNKILLKKINNNESKKNSLLNPNNILNCTESLRNKNKFLNKKQHEKDKIYNMKKNIKYNKYIKNNKKNEDDNKIKKYFDNKKQKEKIDLITDIIMKINNKDYLYKILTKLFGDNLSDKLLSNQASDEFLESIQNAIFEIENINEKYKKINNINEKIEKLYKEKLGIMKNKTKEEEKNETIINYKYGKNQNNIFYKPKIYKNNNINKNKYSEPYQEFNFKKSLRNQTPKTYYKIQNRDDIFNKSKIYSKNKRANSNSKVLESSERVKTHKKPFISATCSYGKYFDEPLQNGGESKLN